MEKSNWSFPTEWLVETVGLYLSIRDGGRIWIGGEQEGSNKLEGVHLE